MLICLVLISASISLSPKALAEAEGDIVVESDMIWVQEMTLAQNVRVVNGGSLTISNAQLSIEEGMNLFVDSNSSILVENSHLVSTDPPSGLVGYGYCDQGNRSGIKVEWPDPQRRMEVILEAIEPSSLDGVTAYYNNQTEELSGEEDSIVFDQGTQGEIWIGLVGPSCYPPSLSSITVKRANSGSVDCAGCSSGVAADFEHRNMMTHGNPGFTIDVEGKMEAVGSSIIGGQISSSGNLNFTDTSFDRVGPVILTSDNSVISLGGSTNFTNSTDDHDIRARGHSTIEWGDDVSGSGGLTDKWERRVANQLISFDAVAVAYEISGMHNTPSYSSFSDESGSSYVKGGNERVVEIAWSEDNTWEEDPVWTEQAVVTITDYRTAWNPMGSGIGDYGGGQFDLVWDQEITVDQSTPDIEWISISAVGEDGNSSTTATIGKSLTIEAVIGNKGTAAAILAIDCNITSSGVAAEMSPNWPNAMIGPGQQEVISFSWRYHSEGHEGLTCRILTPTQLVNDLAFGGGELTSEGISWSEAEDEEGSPLFIPLLLALVIGVVIAGYALVTNLDREYEDEDDYQRTP